MRLLRAHMEPMSAALVSRLVPRPRPGLIVPAVARRFAAEMSAIVAPTPRPGF